MTIQNTDLFLVNTSGGATIAGNKKCEAQNLNGKNGDVLVNRGGVSHKTSIVNIPTTVRDTDLMLVNRGGASYKATGADVQTLFPQGPAGGTSVIENVSDSGSTSKLFLASDKNLDTFTPGDGLQMVGTDGNTAAYVPVTSAITAATPETIAGAWNSASAAVYYAWRGLTYGAGKFVSVTGAPPGEGAMYSYDGLTWTATGVPSAQDWRSVIYGDDKFVAVSASSPTQVMYSADGISWIAANQATGYNWLSVTYGNGTFVAVGNGTDRAMYSADGIGWSAATVTSASTWQSVTYGGTPGVDGKFVAVAFNTSSTVNQVMYSTNGSSWSLAQPADGCFGITAVTYGDGKFVAVGRFGTYQVMYSPDGINWTAATAADSGYWESVTYGDGKFVAVAKSGTNRVMYSADGINWTSTSAAEDNSWESVTYGGGKFVAVSTDGTNQVMWSYTGTGKDENLTTLALTATSKDLKYFNPGDKVTQAANFGTVKSVGTDELVLTDTVSNGAWNIAQAAAFQQWTDVAYANGSYVSVSRTGAQYRSMQSNDGINWQITGGLDPANMWESVAYGNGQFIAVSQNGTYRIGFANSTGLQWQMRNAPAANQSNWVSITYGGQFVAVALGGDSVNSNRIMYSPDGNIWTAINAPENGNGWSGVTYGGDKYVAVSQTGTNRVMWSPDGINWTAAAAASANSWYKIAYGNDKFVAVAYTGTNRVMYSADGITWSSAGVTGVEELLWYDVTFGDGKFVAVSGNGKVMSSTDGISWTTVTPPSLSQWLAVTYGKDKFVAVANQGDANANIGINQVMWSETGTGVDATSDWTTSVGQAAEADKPLSGTGTYSEHTGSVLTVNNSNTEWVDNDNQRGDEYYATTATTRLALAKALSVDDYGVMTANARQWAATAIAGYYPLFRFERIAKLVGDGTAHSHTFDGVTWYMPNGVTYYHGDYSG